MHSTAASHTEQGVDLTEKFVEQQLSSLRNAGAHTASELTNEINAIMDTVSAEPRYTVLTARSGLPELRVLTTTDEVRSYYTWQRSNSHKVLVSRHIQQVVSDWYVFFDTVPTRDDVTTGPYNTNTVVLFPIANDGIRGEILCERDYLVHGPTSWRDGEVEIDAGLPSLHVRNLRLLDQFFEACAKREMDTIASLLAPHCVWSMRSYRQQNGKPIDQASSKPEVLDILDARMSAFDVVGSTILNRIISDWYVFAEQYLTVRSVGLPGIPPGAVCQFREAAIYPITEDGHLMGAVGFGSDIERS